MPEKTFIKKHATPHTFRHKFISVLAETKVNLPTVMEEVGACVMKTTMKIYTHVTKK
ncbi:tyrosine-type recombinase/integrase [Bacillus atrophaeus]|nr:tyrosine-type recombinase/integrase [Bacillus atrophaeus]MCY8497915.1 tyrosine-type recombinase/integrase [Bacillus atrophaeus]MCY8812434.1 tyrosine-type recombinase/integrase [Bacillus atrophaeus]MCY8821580.1 tyrosine-type recombinase/integrase [Bacillus atrophaeus]MCY8830967.1 tyrosine-type recombinase/integrase [Bacillus atrophaeus]MCY8832918.1 tyrosine-type recombinase/integrase [Bacillus atrophaeus]